MLYCAEWDLKTGGATGAPSSSALFIRYLQRSAQSQAHQTAHLLPTIFDFGLEPWPRRADWEKHLALTVRKR